MRFEREGLPEPVVLLLFRDDDTPVRTHRLEPCHGSDCDPFRTPPVQQVVVVRDGFATEHEIDEQWSIAIEP